MVLCEEHKARVTSVVSFPKSSAEVAGSYPLGTEKWPGPLALTWSLQSSRLLLFGGEVQYCPYLGDRTCSQLCEAFAKEGWRLQLGVASLVWSSRQCLPLASRNRDPEVAGRVRR